MTDSDERYTPGWLLDMVREFSEGPIQLDVCTADSNPARALQWWTDGYYDGLRDSWEGAFLNDSAISAGKNIAWCNPPYSRGQVIRWSRKAIEEARDGCEILMLTRADTRTKWFGLLRRNCDAVCFPERSVGFVMPDGTQLPGDTRGHALWHFGRDRARFRRVFEPLGWVVDGPGVQEHLEDEGVA